jgi:hypothetical protein
MLGLDQEFEATKAETRTGVRTKAFAAFLFPKKGSKGRINKRPATDYSILAGSTWRV